MLSIDNLVVSLVALAVFVAGAVFGSAATLGIVWHTRHGDRRPGPPSGSGPAPPPPLAGSERPGLAALPVGAGPDPEATVAYRDAGVGGDAPDATVAQAGSGPWPPHSQDQVGRGRVGVVVRNRGATTNVEVDPEAAVTVGSEGDIRVPGRPRQAIVARSGNVSTISRLDPEVEASAGDQVIRGVVRLVRG